MCMNAASNIELKSAYRPILSVYFTIRNTFLVVTPSPHKKVQQTSAEKSATDTKNILVLIKYQQVLYTYPPPPPPFQCYIISSNHPTTPTEFLGNQIPPPPQQFLGTSLL